MNRRGFLGSLVAFACSPAFPAAPLTYKGVPLVFDGDIPWMIADTPLGAYGINRATNAWWNTPARPDDIVVGPVVMEEMQRQWALCERKE